MCKELKVAFLEYRKNLQKVLKMQILLLLLSAIPTIFFQINTILASTLGIFVFSIVGLSSMFFYKDVEKAGIFESFRKSFGKIMIKYLFIFLIMSLILLLFSPILYTLSKNILMEKSIISILSAIPFSFIILLVFLLFVYPPARLVETNKLSEAIKLIKNIEYFKKAILYTFYMIILTTPFYLSNQIEYFNLLSGFILIFFIYPLLSITYWKVYYGVDQG